MVVFLNFPRTGKRRLHACVVFTDIYVGNFWKRCMARKATRMKVAYVARRLQILEHRLLVLAQSDHWDGEYAILYANRQQEQLSSLFWIRQPFA